jgi:hypothetical protein
MVHAGRPSWNANGGTAQLTITSNAAQATGTSSPTFPRTLCMHTSRFDYAEHAMAACTVIFSFRILGFAQTCVKKN